MARNWQESNGRHTDLALNKHQLGVNVLISLLGKRCQDAGRRLSGRGHRSASPLQKRRADRHGTWLCPRSVAAALGGDLEKVGINGGLVGERDKKEIALPSVRAGDIVGEHTVIFFGIGERLECIHRAHSCDTFARGALCAAKWLANKKPGLYNMDDVLGL
jgi:4-hydroxy-tetrahydrodipicolinate reductase